MTETEPGPTCDPMTGPMMLISARMPNAFSSSAASSSAPAGASVCTMGAAERALHPPALFNDGELSVRREIEHGLDGEHRPRDRRRLRYPAAAAEEIQVVGDDGIPQMAGHVRKAVIRLARGAARVADAQRLFHQLALPDGRRQGVQHEDPPAVLLYGGFRRRARHVHRGRKPARERNVQNLCRARRKQRRKMLVMPFKIDLRRARHAAPALALVKIHVLRILGKGILPFRDAAVLFHHKGKGEHLQISLPYVRSVKIARGIGRNDKLFHTLSCGAAPLTRAHPAQNIRILPYSLRNVKNYGAPAARGGKVFSSVRRARAGFFTRIRGYFRKALENAADLKYNCT